MPKTIDSIITGDFEKLGETTVTGKSTLRDTLLGGSLGALLGIGSGGLGQVLGDGLTTVREPSWSSGTARTLKKQLGVDVPIYTQADEFKPPLTDRLVKKGPFSSIDAPAHVYVPRSAGPGALAHELGHLSHSKTPLGRIVNSKPLRVLSRSTVPILLAGGALGGAMNPDNTAATYGLPIAAGLIQAPGLISEFGASTHGYQALKHTNIGDDALRAAKKNMRRNFLAYAIAALAGISAPMVARRFRKEIQRPAEEATDVVEVEEVE